MISKLVEFITLLSFIGWFVYFIIDAKTDPIKEAIEKLDNNFKILINSLAKDKLIKLEKFFQTNSPKKITEDGKKLLQKVNISEYLSTCSLIKENHSGKSDSDIYIECIKWVEENSEDMVIKMNYHGDISKEDGTILLALALKEAITQKNS